MRLFVFYVPNLRFGFQTCWITKKIKNLFYISSGSTPSRKDSSNFKGNINWISSGELKEKYLYDTEEKINDNSLHVYNIDTLVIAIYGLEAVGVRGTASLLKVPSTISQACMAFEPISSDISNEFLYYWYKKHGEIIGLKYAQGTKQQNLCSEIVENFDISFPPIKEQQIIIKFMDLLDKRIIAQSKIINKLESLICSLRSDIFNKYDWKWQRLDSFINNGTITLKRGNVIPKHEKNEEYKFPVYSSSIHNNGLMGFNNSYMFDKELITWSVDGGGNFFYRSKHKFNVTNVCGIMEVKDNIFNYRFLSEILSAQHSKLIFDYQTKAHPSVIEKLYKLPIVEIKTQEKIALIFELYYQKLEKEKDILSLYKKQKAYLLHNMFI